MMNADKEVMGTLVRVADPGIEENGPPYREFHIRTKDGTEISLKAASLHSWPAVLGDTYRFSYNQRNWITAIETVEDN